VTEIMHAMTYVVVALHFPIEQMRVDLDPRIAH
jgi:hypothetical protein